jgi:hypothetical protein
MENLNKAVFANLVINLHQSKVMNGMKKEMNGLSQAVNETKNVQKELLMLGKVQGKQLSKIDKTTTQSLIITKRVEAERQEQKALKSLIFIFIEKFLQVENMPAGINKYLHLYTVKTYFEENNVEPNRFEELSDKERCREILEKINLSEQSEFERLTEEAKNDLIQMAKLKNDLNFLESFDSAKFVSVLEVKETELKRSFEEVKKLLKKPVNKKFIKSLVFFFMGITTLVATALLPQALLNGLLGFSSIIAGLAILCYSLFQFVSGIFKFLKYRLQISGAVKKKFDDDKAHKIMDCDKRINHILQSTTFNKGDLLNVENTKEDITNKIVNMFAKYEDSDEIVNNLKMVS